jgi:hypothetical protein
MGIGELLIRILYDAHAILEQASAAPEQLAVATFAGRIYFDDFLLWRWEDTGANGRGP